MKNDEWPEVTDGECFGERPKYPVHYQTEDCGGKGLRCSPMKSRAVLAAYQVGDE